MENIDHSK